MSTHAATSKRLDFRNLPLVDVAVRAVLESPIELTFAAVNHLYGALRGDFPTLTELEELQVPPGIKPAPMKLAPGIAGAKFAGHAHGLSVTIQSQMIIARWEKPILPDAPSYPRFAALAAELWRAVGEFQKWYAVRGVRAGTAAPALRVLVVNMSYVNFLSIRHVEPVLTRYFSEKIHIAALGNAQQTHKVELSWRESDQVDLRFEIEQVNAIVDGQQTEGFRLTTAAGQHVKPDGAERAALERVHDRMQSFFFDILSAEAKKEWQLERGSD